jgi:uncharacterized membrane protein YfcA
MVNALAGGGTLITFPALITAGVPPVAANVTNTVALCPGYLGGALAQRKDLLGQKRRLWLFMPAGALGGIIGGLLLLNTGEKLFTDLIPFLILLASTLLAANDLVRGWLARRSSKTASAEKAENWAVLPVALAAVYGGYFGAGLSVIVMAVLGITLDDSMTRINALKQTISLSANLAAAIFFLFSGKVDWLVALVMAVGALVGGALGGRLAGRIKPSTLRWTVVAIGVVVGVVYLFK